jgi:hypothetical protein
MSGLTEYSTKERIQTPYHHIDPGFINHRLCFSTFGLTFNNAFQKHRNPGNDHLSKLHNDHLIVDLALAQCRAAKTLSFGEVIAYPKLQTLWCSTEDLEGNENVYDEKHARNRILLPYDFEQDCFLEFHTKHFVADTGILEQSQKSTVAIIAGIHLVNGNEIISRPTLVQNRFFLGQHLEQVSA